MCGIIGLSLLADGMLKKQTMDACFRKERPTMFIDVIANEQETFRFDPSA
jgi:hypothetical protein